MPPRLLIHFTHIWVPWTLGPSAPPAGPDRMPILPRMMGEVPDGVAGVAGVGAGWTGVFPPGVDKPLPVGARPGPAVVAVDPPAVPATGPDFGSDPPLDLGAAVPAVLPAAGEEAPAPGVAGTAEPGESAGAPAEVPGSVGAPVAVPGSAATVVGVAAAFDDVSSSRVPQAAVSRTADTSATAIRRPDRLINFSMSTASQSEVRGRAPKARASYRFRERSSPNL